MKIQPFSFCKSVLPISAGDFEMVIPADFITSILSSAPPFPPEIIAPA